MNIHPDADRFGGWSWRGPSHGEHFRRCNYCGSVHPADLAAEPAWRADWADRKYGWPHKFYADVPNRNPEQRFITTALSNRDPQLNDGTGYTWVRATEIPADVNIDGWRDIGEHYRWVGLGTRAAHFGKFYTIHLADPEISAETKRVIERGSGLVFTFTDDGRVTWRPWAGLP